MARTATDWRRWYHRWEAQQEHFNPARERRFQALLDLLAASVPPRFTVLDLGAGPGSLSVRLLRRFPNARCVAVDHDPVTRRVGRGTFGSFGGRLSWVDADLGAPAWDRALPPGRFEAAVSTTALHWLDPVRLARLYRDLGRRLRRGGVFLNGDRIPFGDAQPELARLVERVRRRRFGGLSLSAEWDQWGAPWRRWWAAAERDAELGPLFAQRTRLGFRRDHHENVPLAFHLRALRRAGFEPVEILWRRLEDSVLYARR